ncbi:MAG: hypothetical protein MJK14_11780, partial [Rivularia sp. ALOHA_DT_140]|nr:hypothetical protein [Rivularia sp. ALOHA_DT_140]
GKLKDEQILKTQNIVNYITEENNFIAISDNSLDIQITNLHATLSSIQKNVVAASISQDEKQLVTTDMGAISFWNLETGTRMRREPLKLIRAITFAETIDKLITFDFEGNITLRCSTSFKPLVGNKIQQDITALYYISNKVLALLLNNSVLILDPKNLEIVEQTDKTILEQPMIVRSEQQWWTWNNSKETKRIAFFTQGNVVIWQGNQVLISSGCEPFVLIWDGKDLKSAIDFTSGKK